MKCPTCNVELKMTVRQEVEIDYCPQCRGVWLDRGELDKIIERSAAADFDDDRDDRNYRERSEEHDEARRYPEDKRRRRKSFFGEMFDIFD